MENKVKAACLFARLVDCWHEWEWDAPMTEVVCKKCCMKRAEPTMPDPLHNDGDMRRLEVGMMRHEGWESFEEYSRYAARRRGLGPLESRDFIPWLLKDPSRFVDLIWRFTGLEEVQKAYGMTECPTCWKPGDYTGALPVFCPTCNGSGKVPAPWLKERRKSCQG